MNNIENIIGFSSESILNHKITKTQINDSCDSNIRKMFTKFVDQIIVNAEFYESDLNLENNFDWEDIKVSFLKIIIKKDFFDEKNKKIKFIDSDQLSSIAKTIFKFIGTPVVIIFEINNYLNLFASKIFNEEYFFNYSDKFTSTDWINLNDLNDNEINFFKSINLANLDNHNIIYFYNAFCDEIYKFNEIRFINNGQYNEAIEIYDLFLLDDPLNIDLLKNKSLALFNQGKYKDALDCYNKLIEIDENVVDIEFYNLIYENFENTFDKDSYSKECKLEGDKAFKNGQYEIALQKFNEYIKFNDISIEILNKKGCALFKLNEFTKANKCFMNSLNIHTNSGALIGMAYCYLNKVLTDDNIKNDEKDKLTEIIFNYLDDAIQYDLVALLVKAKFLAVLRDFNSGIMYYDRYLQINDTIDDNYFKAVCGKAFALQEINEFDNALECYDLALRKNKKNVEILFKKAELLYNLKRYDDSISCFDNILKIDKFNLKSIYYKGLALIHKKDFEGALNSYDYILKKDKSFFEVLMIKGELLAKIHKYNESLGCFNKVPKRYLSKCHMEFIKYIEKQEAKYGNSGYYSVYEMHNSDGYWNYIYIENDSLKMIFSEDLDDLRKKVVKKGLFWASLDKKITKESIKRNHILQMAGGELIFRFKFKYTVNNPKYFLKIKPQCAEDWNLKGYSLCFDNNYKEAIKCFDMALKDVPKNSKYLNNKGYALFNLKYKGESLQCFENAVKYNPNDHYAWFNLGFIFSKMNKYKDMMNCFDKFLELYVTNDKNKFYCLMDIGREFHNRGYHNESLKFYDEALKIKEDHANLWYFKALCLDDSNDFDYAILCFDKALKLSPNDENFKESKALCLFNKAKRLYSDNKYEEALNYFNQALKIIRDFADCWHFKALCLQRIGDYDMSIKSFDEALKLDPNNIIIKQEKENLLNSISLNDHIN